MGDSQSRSRSGAADGEREALLATRVSIPRVRPDFMTRPRLLEMLNEAVRRDLVVIAAPAGYGKTTTLAEWADSARSPVAWLSLEQSDNDPARFWRSVIAAIHRVSPEVVESVHPLLRESSAASAEGIVAAFLKGLASALEVVALILDDYQVIEATPIHEALSLLLAGTPSQLRLLIASRADPQLPLARLRVQGRLAELRATDLRFTPTEGAAFLSEVFGLELPAEAVAALHDRTEGWPAGLQLAAISLRGRPDPARFIEAFSGSHRYVFDYLSEEVLQGQPDRVRKFLLETSVLDRICAPLCDAVVGGSGGKELLLDLERENLFLIPLDAERRWYRYHHLFRDLLRSRAKQEHPERLPVLHARAANWCERHGLIDEAIVHWLAGGQAERAVVIMEDHLEGLFVRGEGATARRWLDALPPELVRTRPLLSTARAATELMAGRVGEVEPLLGQAERAASADGRSQGSAREGPSFGLAGNVPVTILILRAELAKQRGDAEGTERLAHRAGELTAEGDRYLEFLTGWNIGLGQLMLGRVREAEEALRRIVQERRQAGDAYHGVAACFAVAQARRAQGRLGAALSACRTGLDIAAELGGPDLPAAGIAHAGVAEILRERDELDDALRHAEEAVVRCRQLLYFQWAVTSLGGLAAIREALGDRDGADQAIEEAARVVPLSEPFVDLFNPVPVQRARQLLSTGEVAEAFRWTRERGLTAEDEPSFLREREYLVLAQVLLARGAFEPAQALLTRLRTLAATQGRTGSVLEAQILLAVGLQAAGDEDGARAAVSEALPLAEPEGYVRIFADEGPVMAGLLRRLVSAGQRGRRPAALNVHLGYLNQLARAATHPGRRDSSMPSVRAAGLVEPLTERELEVLQLLGAGKRNREIAVELVITVDTVKRHLTHIFEKLGAVNRTQAVSQARDLGLLTN